MRLEIAEQLPEVHRASTLLQNFDLPENAVYRINGPVNLNRVIQVYDLVQPAGPEVPAVQAAPRRVDDEAPFETHRARATCCCTIPSTASRRCWT